MTGLRGSAILGQVADGGESGRLRAAGFTDPVAPRILIGSAPTRELNRLRRELGEGIFRMKHAYTEVPPDGVQATLD